MLRTWLSSLRARLILLVLFALLPTLAFFLFSDLDERRAAAQQASQEALRLASVTAASQESVIVQVRGILITLANLPQIQNATPDECSQFLALLNGSYPSTVNLGVADPQGDVFCSAVPLSGPTNIGDRPYFQQAITTRGLGIGDYQIGRATGVRSINLGYPVLDANGQVRAVVFAAVGLDWLNGLVAEVQLPEGTTLSVIYGQGTVLARLPDPQSWVGKPVPEKPIFQAIRSRQGEGTETAPGPDGLPRLFGFTSVAGLPQGSVYVSVGIPTSVAFAEANRTLARNLAGLGIIAVLVFGAAWFGADLLVLRRTRSLVNASRRLASGDLSARTGLPYGEDELSLLARTFDEMAGSFAQREVERAREEERFRSVAEGSLAGVYIIQDDKFRYVNPMMAQVMGYSVEEVIDHLSPLDLVHPDDRPAVTESIRRLIQGELDSVRFTVRWIRKNGTVLHFEVLGRRWVYGGRPAIIGSGVDATERIQAEEELHRVNRALRTLSQGSKALVRASDESSLLESVCRILVEQSGYRLAWVGLAEQDEQKTIRPVAQAGYEQGYLENLHLTWADEERGRGPAGTAIRTAKPVIAKDIATDPNFTLWREQAMKRGFASAISLPLGSENTQPLGLLNIYAAEPNAFNAEEVQLLTELANDLGYGIEALRMREAHRQGQEQLERQLVRLESLRTIDTTIAASLDLGLTLNVLLDQVTTQLKVDAADVLLLNPHSQFLEHAAARGFRTEALKHTRLRLGEGYAGQAALRRSPVRIPALSDAPDGLRRAPLLLAEGFAAYYGMPLIAKGTVKGVLEIFHRSPLEPDREWEEFLDNLAGQAALAIDAAELFTDLQRSNLDLTLAYDATIEGWSRALDLRDKETEGHTQRVTEMAESLARALGVEGETLLHVRRGALLHDIGKMGVPDAILLKPGPLTEEEWVIMRKHPTYAFEMLSPIAYLKPALDIPYCHHEKWDGTGYPRGLKGEEIPLSARAFAVIDVWDALRSDRPYRPRWAEEEVLEHIHEQTGKHFDPRVVEAFLTVLKETEGGRT